MKNKDVTFQLDTDAAAAIVGSMAMPLIQSSTNAVAARAQSMASSISTEPPAFVVKAEIGTIRRGKRAVGTVSANFNNKRERYIAATALAKAKDAGRVN